MGKVCIVGGGVSGVSAARVLLAEGVDCTLFEKSGSLGGVWASNYYKYGVQTPAALYHFPDGPIPEEDFTPGPVVNKCIQDYADKHGIMKIAKLNCGVDAVVPEYSMEKDTRGEDHPIVWRVSTIDGNGKRDTHTFDYVINAAGVYSQVRKYIPDFEGIDLFEGRACHSSDFTDVASCKGKNVVTVGYGKSAFECSMWAKLDGEAAKSTLLFRETHWVVPRKILGLIPFQWATFSRFGCGILLPTYPTLGPVEWVVHMIPGLLTFVWWLVAQIFSLQFGLGKLKPKKSFVDDFWGSHGIVPDPNFFPMVNRGEIDAKQGEIKKIHANTVELKSGELLPADVLIFGTGFKQDFSFAPKEILDDKKEDGHWLYRNMVHPKFPTMVFLSSNTTTFTSITTAGIQARWFYEVYSQRLLPSSEEMHREIEETREWKRRTMPSASDARAYLVQTHQLHYHDQLLKDMGASIRRKRGCCAFLKEIAFPYRPSDYDTIVSGEFKTRKGESVPLGQRQWSFCREFVMALPLIILVEILMPWFFASSGWEHIPGRSS